MKPHPDKTTSTADRRANQRRQSAALIRLSVDKTEIDGKAENISETGVLFLTASELRVAVEIEENGAKRRRTGRLIRSQVMGAGKVGWAVEFDSQ